MQKYKMFLSVLNKELIPALGCTEPIAIALAAATMRKTMGLCPKKLS